MPNDQTSQDNEKDWSRFNNIPLYTSLLFSYAMQYAHALEIEKSKVIRTLFAGFVFPNGFFMNNETLTTMRIINLTICGLTNDYDWQVIALPIEKEIGFWNGKESLIKWASVHGIPIEKTRSCITDAKHHCETCTPCRFRKRGFIKAGVLDKTLYLLYRVKPLNKLKKNSKYLGDGCVKN